MERGRESSFRALLAIGNSGSISAVEPGEDRAAAEGGEALPNDDPKWYALWTHSNFEQIVHDQLQAKGFQPFLPTIQVWSRRRGRRLIRVGPMFPGYLFLRHAMDKSSYVEVVKSRGL